MFFFLFFDLFMDEYLKNKEKYSFCMHVFGPQVQMESAHLY